MERYTAETFEFEHIRITPDGLFQVEWVPDRKKSEETKKRNGYWAMRRVKKNRVLRKLKLQCLLDDSTTLLDIMNMVASYRLLRFFISEFSWCDVDAFIEQARLPKEDDDRQIDRLEIYRTPMTDPYFDAGYEFHGVGARVTWKGEPEEDQNLPRDQGYAVSYSPLNQFAHLKVVLVDKQEVYRHGSKTPAFEGVNTFTLLDVLDAIFDDISFSGPTPEHNARFTEEINETIANYQNMTDEERDASFTPIQFLPEEDEQKDEQDTDSR